MSSLIVNFEQVIKPSLVWNIYFTFLLSVVDCTFYKSNIKSHCILLLCQVQVRSSRQEMFCKKGALKNFTNACNFIKKETLAQLFSCEFREISKNTIFYRTPLVAASKIRVHKIIAYLCFTANAEWNDLFCWLSKSEGLQIFLS